LTFDLDMTFVVHPTGWEPVELLYAPLPWQSYVRTAEFTGAPVCDDAGEVLFVNFVEYWAQQSEAQGWLDQPNFAMGDETAVDADGRLPGCESTNHTQCYGELWQCSACGKTVCYAEGSDSYPELCDDCWCQRQMGEEEVDVPF
jgi:hypothetical protein